MGAGFRRKKLNACAGADVLYVRFDLSSSVRGPGPAEAEAEVAAREGAPETPGRGRTGRTAATLRANVLGFSRARSGMGARVGCRRGAMSGSPIFVELLTAGLVSDVKSSGYRQEERGSKVT